MRQTKVAILIPCLQAGGTEVSTLETSRSLLNLGFRVDVIVYFDEIDHRIRETFAHAGVNVLLLGIRRGGGLLSNVQLAAKLIWTMLSTRYALVWIQYMTPTFLPLIIGRFFTRRLIAAVHVGGDHHRGAAIGRLRWFARWWCNRFVCVSRASACGIFGSGYRHQSSWKRVTILPNAIDLDSTTTALPRLWREELSLPRESIIIGYVGRLAHNKGADILLRSVALLRSMADVHIVIVGSGSELARLCELATDLEISSRTHFVGGVSRQCVFSAIKGFDVAVVPSREEGFGLSALEAMACGVPVIVSRVDALLELVDDGKAGLCFDIHNPESLAIQLMTLISQKDFSTSLAKAALHRASLCYGVPIYRQRLERMLGEIDLLQAASK